MFSSWVCLSGIAMFTGGFFRQPMSFAGKGFHTGKELNTQVQYLPQSSDLCSSVKPRVAFSGEAVLLVLFASSAQVYPPLLCHFFYRTSGIREGNGHPLEGISKHPLVDIARFNILLKSDCKIPPPKGSNPTILSESYAREANSLPTPLSEMVFHWPHLSDLPSGTD